MTFNARTKRISNPSCDLFTFVAQVKERFRALRELNFIVDKGRGFRTSWNDDEYLGLVPLGNSLHHNFQKFGQDYKDEANSFGLKWLSNSSMQESVMDMSLNAVDVTSNEQFYEIMRIHSGVTKERSIPRFLCFMEEEDSFDVFGPEVQVSYVMSESTIKTEKMHADKHIARDRAPSELPQDSASELVRSMFGGGESARIQEGKSMDEDDYNAHF